MKQHFTETRNGEQFSIRRIVQRCDDRRSNVFGRIVRAINELRGIRRVVSRALFDPLGQLVWSRQLENPPLEQRFVPPSVPGPLAVDRVNGRLYIAERKFRWYRGFATRIRRITLKGGQIAAQTRLLDSPFGELDNTEGISVWQDANGTTIITLLSDDNFNPLQTTRVTEFRLLD